eukprot:783576-Prorocentrum_lima.AAC.1
MKDVERNMGGGIRFALYLEEDAGLVSLAGMIQGNEKWVRQADTVWVFSWGSDCGKLSEFEWAEQWGFIGASLQSM